MNNEAVLSATGRSLDQWFAVIAAEGLAEADHKAIADHLHEANGVPYWWAQTITVKYEQHIGRRVPGQTQDGYFQLGASKTIDQSAASLWGFLDSRAGLRLVFAETLSGSAADAGTPPDGGFAGLDLTTDTGFSASTTTYVPGSHARIRWREAAWETHSILQIRVTAKDAEKSTVTFHHEKLPGPAEREVYLNRWKEALESMAKALSPGDQSSRDH